MWESLERVWQIMARFLGLAVTGGLDSDDVTYLFALISDYKTLDSGVENAGAREIADDIVQKARNPHDLNWADIHSMEKALLHLVPFATLRRHAWNLRARYRDMVGPDVYELYIRSGPPNLAGPSTDSAEQQQARNLLTTGDVVVTAANGAENAAGILPVPEAQAVGEAPAPAAANAAAAASNIGVVPAITVSPVQPESAEAEQLLRTDLLLLLREVQWLYIYWPSRERIRNRLYFAVAFTAMVMVGVALYFYVTGVTTGDSDHVTTITLVALCGVIGGFISTQARLYGLPKGVHMINLYELRLSPLSVWQAPISGGVFAVVLYLVFLGGLLDGALFPRMALVSKPTSTDVENVRIQALKASEKAFVSKAAADRAADDAAAADKDAVQQAERVNGLMQKSGLDPTSVAGAASKSLEAAKVAAARKQAHLRATKQATADRVVADSASSHRAEVENSANSVTPFSWDNLNRTEPASIPDFGKLLVWAFIAGFAERFVPDTLQRLIGKSQAIKGAQK